MLLIDPEDAYTRLNLREAVNDERMDRINGFVAATNRDRGLLTDYIGDEGDGDLFLDLIDDAWEAFDEEYAIIAAEYEWIDAERAVLDTELKRFGLEPADFDGAETIDGGGPS